MFITITPTYLSAVWYPEGAVVEVLADDDGMFNGLFFQDKHMMQAFSAYPELLCLDATYKLLQLRLPVFLMLVEDSNGESEIVMACVLASEDSDSIQWMVDAFKSHNKNWSETRVVMADKDLKERDVVKKSFPGVDVLICLFHTLRTSGEKLRQKKWGSHLGKEQLALSMCKNWHMLLRLKSTTN